MNALFSVIVYTPEEIKTVTQRYQVFNLKHLHVVCDQLKPRQLAMKKPRQPAKKKPRQRRRRSLASKEEEASPANKKKPRQRRRRSLASKEEEASPASEEFSPSIGEFALTLTRCCFKGFIVLVHAVFYISSSKCL